MPARSFKTYEKQENSLSSQVMYLLSKIREELDPTEFSLDQVREEFGQQGGEDTGSSAFCMPMNLKTSFELLVRHGFIQEDGENLYSVTERGIAVEID